MFFIHEHFQLSVKVDCNDFHSFTKNCYLTKTILYSIPTSFNCSQLITSLIIIPSLSGTETLLKDSYSVTVVTTDLSRKCGLSGDNVLRVSSNGLLVSRSQKLGTFLEWKHIGDVLLTSDVNEKNKLCVLSVDRFVSLVCFFEL